MDDAGSGLVIRAGPAQVFWPVAWRASLGAAGLGVSLGDEAGVAWSSLLLGVIWLGTAAAMLPHALRTVGAVIMRVGPEGLSGVDGQQLQTWNGVVSVWVGYVPRLPLLGRLQGPQLKIFTRSGIDFARRADTDVKPSSTYRLATTMSITELCSALRTLTSVPIIDGDDASRWQVARRLLDPDRPDHR